MKFVRLHTDFEPTLSVQSSIPCSSFNPDEQVSVSEFLEQYARTGLLPSRKVQDGCGDSRLDNDILDAGYDLANRNFLDPLEVFVDNERRALAPKSVPPTSSEVGPTVTKNTEVTE